MAEFETGGHRYQSGKMHVRDQLHLLRGLGPLFPSMMQYALMDQTDAATATRQVQLILPFFDTFAKMDTKQVDDLVSKCFAVTRRGVAVNGSTQWGPPLWGGRDQYDDLSLGDLFTICWQVIQENLGGFFGIGTLPVPDQTSAPIPLSPELHS
jgi:hypothetical protein